MIVLENVRKSYRSNGIVKHVINSLNFEFPAGRNVALIGPNGAGKSTLIRLISGAELPDDGRILRKGTISWPLGFSAGFNGSMTGLENVRFLSRVYGADSEAVMDYVAEFSELGESLYAPIKTYSSGMKARLSFGVSMAINFDCYLVDEIVAVGDERFNKKSNAAFRDKMPNSQIIMVSHSMSKISEYCSCGILLTKNDALYYDNITDLVASYMETMRTP